MSIMPRTSAGCFVVLSTAVCLWGLSQQALHFEAMRKARESVVRECMRQCGAALSRDARAHARFGEFTAAWAGARDDDDYGEGSRAADGQKLVARGAYPGLAKHAPVWRDHRPVWADALEARAGAIEAELSAVETFSDEVVARCCSCRSLFCFERDAGAPPRTAPPLKNKRFLSSVQSSAPH
jgi:hypothetical protein